MKELNLRLLFFLAVILAMSASFGAGQEWCPDACWLMNGQGGYMGRTIRQGDCYRVGYSCECYVTNCNRGNLPNCPAWNEWKDWYFDHCFGEYYWGLCPCSLYEY
jgi:hypothetical protein